MATYLLSEQALQRFDLLRHLAVDTVSAQFYTAHAAEYARFGERGRKACREDIEYQLDFLRPVLQFGSLPSYVDYLRWLGELLTARRIPVAHITESLILLGEFFIEQMPEHDGATIAAAIQAAAEQSIATGTAMPTQNPSRNNLWPEQEKLAASLLSGNRQLALSAIVEAMARGHTLIEVYVHLIQPALYDIGYAWMQNKISVAKEHLATATAQTAMAEAYTKTRMPPANSRKALFACVEGNAHSVGLRMVSDAYELSGWNVQFLGADTPTSALIEQAHAWQPDLIGISIAFPHQIKTAREAVRMIRTQLNEHCPKIIVGGIAVNRFAGLAQYIQADGHAENALTALNITCPNTSTAK